MTGLADCNNFFVSCERSVDASLKGKAVVVLSNNDGCIVARSNEAKHLGIKMGQAAFEIRDLVESGSVIALSGNHLLYRDISLKVHDIFHKFVPDCIDYSVDEAFLDVSGIPVDALRDIGYAITEACLEELDIPVTVGFAPTKTLAKISTELCKKLGKPVGVLADRRSIEDIIKTLPVTELWGVGRRLAKQMYQAGIYTVADLAHAEPMWIRKKFGINGERLRLELNGVPCIELNHVSRTLQDSISESRTFPCDVDDYDYLRARIVIYASDCARKLRAMHGLCSVVGVFLRTNPFHINAPRLFPEGCIGLPYPTCDTSKIVNSAIAVLNEIFPEGVEFKRAGVWLGEIVSDAPRTYSIFEEEISDSLERKRFMNTIDNINNIVGVDKITIASRIVKDRQGHNDGYSSSFHAPRAMPDEK